MKKKIALILSLCLMVLGLTACGEDPTKVDYNGYSYDQLKEQVQSTAQGLLAMSDDQIEQYKSNENEQYKMLTDMVTRWDDATEDVGKYQKLGDFTITKSGKTLTCEQEIVFKERSVILTFVFTYYNMELDDVTVDTVQTLGEKMANAGLNTLMGMGVVFTVLILISLIIYGFKIFPYLEQKKKKNEKAVSVSYPVLSNRNFCIYTGLLPVLPDLFFIRLYGNFQIRSVEGRVNGDYADIALSPVP